jgi:hypothetical protein
MATTGRKVPTGQKFGGVATPKSRKAKTLSGRAKQGIQKRIIAKTRQSGGGQGG